MTSVDQAIDTVRKWKPGDAIDLYAGGQHAARVLAERISSNSLEPKEMVSLVLWHAQELLAAELVDDNMWENDDDPDFTVDLTLFVKRHKRHMEILSEVAQLSPLAICEYEGSNVGIDMFPMIESPYIQGMWKWVRYAFRKAGVYIPDKGYERLVAMTTHTEEK